jgi:hypothetical protein
MIFTNLTAFVWHVWHNYLEQTASLAIAVVCTGWVYVWIWQLLYLALDVLRKWNITVTPKIEVCRTDVANKAYYQTSLLPRVSGFTVQPIAQICPNYGPWHCNESIQNFLTQCYTWCILVFQRTFTVCSNDSPAVVFITFHYSKLNVLQFMFVQNFFIGFQM